MIYIRKTMKINLLFLALTLIFFLLNIPEALIISLSMSAFLLIVTVICYILQKLILSENDLLELSIKQNNLRLFIKIIKKRKNTTCMTPFHITKYNNLEIMKEALKYKKIRFSYRTDQVFLNATKEMKNILWNDINIKKILKEEYIDLYNSLKLLETKNKISNF
jgi:hypothetical protein